VTCGLWLVTCDLRQAQDIAEAMVEMEPIVVTEEMVESVLGVSHKSQVTVPNSTVQYSIVQCSAVQ